MREYEIIDIAGASCGEINDIISFSCCYYTIAGYRIYVSKFFDGDIIVAALNLCTLECSYYHHISSIDKVIDNLVACNEDFIPYIYE